MKFMRKVSKYLLLRCFLLVMLSTIPIISSAQVETAYIVVTPSSLHANCHTWTGCGVIVTDVSTRYHYHKYKRHRVYYRSCDVSAGCCVRNCY